MKPYPRDHAQEPQLVGKVKGDVRAPSAKREYAAVSVWAQEPLTSSPNFYLGHHCCGYSAFEDD